MQIVALIPHIFDNVLQEHRKGHYQEHTGAFSSSPPTVQVPKNTPKQNTSQFPRTQFTAIAGNFEETVELTIPGRH